MAEELVIKLEEDDPKGGPADLRPNRDLDEAFGVPRPPPQQPPPQPPPPDSLQPGKRAADRLDPAARRIEDVLDRLRRGLLTTSEAFDRMGRLARQEGTVDFLREQGLAKPGGELAALRGLLQNVAPPGGGVAKPAEVQPGDLTLRTFAKEFEDQQASVMYKFRQEKLTAEEAHGRLVKLGGTEEGKEYLRERHGAKVDPAALFREDINAAAKEEGIGGLKAPGLMDKLKPLLSRLPGGGAAGAVGDLLGSAGGGLAEAAGPVGIALGVAELGARKLTGTIDTLSADVTRMGEATRGVARNEVLPAFNAAVGKAADSLGEIPIVGKIYAAELKLFANTVNQARQVIDAFANRGKELAQINGQIAGAAAREDVRHFLADMREAGALQKEYSDLLDARTNLDVKTQDQLIEIKKILIPMATRAADIGAFMVNTLGPVVTAHLQVARDGAHVALPVLQILSTAVTVIVGLVNRGVANAEEQRKKDERDAAVAIWAEMDKLMDVDFDFPTRRPDPADVAAKQRLNQPLLG